MVERIMSSSWKTQPDADREARLVAAAKRDPRDFGELYLLYVQPVFRYFYSRLGNTQEAEDATAQTFLAALERFPSYRHEGYFASWLFAIARNKASDYFRRKRDVVGLDDAERILFQTDPTHDVIQSERAAALAKLIHALPDDKQELIRLRYVADLSFSEIGYLLRQKEDTAKKSLYRLLDRLKAQMEDYHD